MSGKDSATPPSPSFFHRHRRKIVATALILAAMATAAYFLHQEIDREELVAWGKSLPIWLLVVAFVVLPLVGVPISLLLLLIGLRLGLTWGMVLATTAMFFHVLASYRLAHGLFRDKVRDWCERKGYAIPPVDPKHRALFTAVFAAVHGPPYAMKLYLLALTDIPLRFHLLVGAPVYIFFAILPVAFGHAFTEMKIGWIIVVVTIAVGTVVIGRWLKGKFARPDAGLALDDSR